jgi:hypothetical protein
MNDAILAKAGPPTVLTTAGVRRGNRWQQSFVPVVNEPGELMMIDKHQLQIDPRYQRRLWADRIARMAANWSWISCGALIVAQRSDSAVYFLIDGQHRWEAAKLVPSISHLPCLKFELDEVRDEAIGFLATNTERKFPSLAEQFKALLLVGDATAQVADRLAKAAGRRIGAPAGPVTISAVSTLLFLIQQDPEAVERCWPTLAKLCEGKAMTARMLQGVVGLERRMPRRETLGNPPWSARLIHVGYDRVNETIRQVVAMDGNNSQRAVAEGVVRALNRGLRQVLNPVWNRFPK